MTSLYNVHANIKKQGSRAKQECELQHGYPCKTAETRYGAICSKFEFGSEHVNPSVMGYFGLHSDFIWCDAVLGRS